MSEAEARHQLVSALLGAEGALGRAELAKAAELEPSGLDAALAGLLRERLVVELSGQSAEEPVKYRWAARWRTELERRTAGIEATLRECVPQAERAQSPVDPWGPEATSFHEALMEYYHPPEDKPWLVVLQCSVRRPFSSSPSHASMRRAVWVATGCDPGADFLGCPVHTAVLASTIGIVPYELENTYPANVGSGGMKHFDDAYYQRAREVVASRFVEYLGRHAGHYQAAATFTHGRYGEVMEDVRREVSMPMAIFPHAEGAKVTRMGTSRPRKYWETGWVQLAEEILSWLPDEQEAAAARLRELDVEWA